MARPEFNPRALRAVALALLGTCAFAALAQSASEPSMNPELANAGAAGVSAPGAPAAPAPLFARKRDHENRRAQAMTSAVDEHVAALLPYAALASEVYCDALYERQREGGFIRSDDPECTHGQRAQRHGWVPLETYPNGKLGPDDYRGMRFAVYYLDHGPGQAVELGVGFRGTDFKSPADWHSNLRWVLPGRDQYDVLAEIASGVIEASKKAAQAALGRAVNDWRIVATGHSLGGGLAQLFAYKSAQVQGAVVFDPSPVTGFHSCVQDSEVNCNVPVWRVYEQGEVLSYLRAFTRLFYPLSENITELEFDFLGGNLIANHSMPRFYGGLKGRLQQLPAPAHPVLANLFDDKADCDCSRHRRPELFATVRDRCEHLQARPVQSLMAVWGEYGPPLESAPAVHTARAAPVPVLPQGGGYALAPGRGAMGSGAAGTDATGGDDSAARP